MKLIEPLFHHSLANLKEKLCNCEYRKRKGIICTHVRHFVTAQTEQAKVLEPVAAVQQSHGLDGVVIQVEIEHALVRGIRFQGCQVADLQNQISHGPIMLKSSRCPVLS